MATPARRMSVKDRIKMVEKEEKKHGNEQLLKTFSANTKTENHGELNKSVTTTTHNNVELTESREWMVGTNDEERVSSTMGAATIQCGQSCWSNRVF